MSRKNKTVRSDDIGSGKASVDCMQLQNPAVSQSDEWFYGTMAQIKAMERRIDLAMQKNTTVAEEPQPQDHRTGEPTTATAAAAEHPSASATSAPDRTHSIGRQEGAASAHCGLIEGPSGESASLPKRQQSTGPPRTPKDPSPSAEKAPAPDGDGSRKERPHRQRHGHIRRSAAPPKRMQSVEATNGEQPGAPLEAPDTFDETAAAISRLQRDIAAMAHEHQAALGGDDTGAERVGVGVMERPRPLDAAESPASGQSIVERSGQSIVERSLPSVTHFLHETHDGQWVAVADGAAAGSGSRGQQGTAERVGEIESPRPPDAHERGTRESQSAVERSLPSKSELLYQVPDGHWVSRAQYEWSGAAADAVLRPAQDTQDKKQHPHAHQPHRSTTSNRTAAYDQQPTGERAPPSFVPPVDPHHARHERGRQLAGCQMKALMRDNDAPRGGGGGSSGQQRAAGSKLVSSRAVKRAAGPGGATKPATAKQRLVHRLSDEAGRLGVGHEGVCLVDPSHARRERDRSLCGRQMASLIGCQSGNGGRTVCERREREGQKKPETRARDRFHSRPSVYEDRRPDKDQKSTAQPHICTRVHSGAEIEQAVDSNATTMKPQDGPLVDMIAMPVRDGKVPMGATRGREAGVNTEVTVGTASHLWNQTRAGQQGTYRNSNGLPPRATPASQYRAMASLLQPAPHSGARGVKSRDHTRDNIRRLREQDAIGKAFREAAERIAGQSSDWKMPRFANVKGAVDSDRRGGGAGRREH
ncbi:unnamed protein product [Vitrella brassicaformis CCMP3155]|uniref:Uncharacterized protein n=1 Tax=Vitrella brassicaformis (strain CCMP3155) TaxID=1169540 RepID=A0A0G4G4R8_VITBC|nr:unnamed protein product [Vitrella brassicaformis CCMP3155]|eukprot:CEM23407.1 unnamed protein product [Vitrella brassicaformis CCMP3155]